VSAVLSGFEWLTQGRQSSLRFARHLPFHAPLFIWLCDLGSRTVLRWRSTQMLWCTVQGLLWKSSELSVYRSIVVNLIAASPAVCSHQAEVGLRCPAQGRPNVQHKTLLIPSAAWVASELLSCCHDRLVISWVSLTSSELKCHSSESDR